MTTNMIASRGTLHGRMGFVALLGLFAELPGCAQEPLCDELKDCGGPVPAGQWELDPAHPSCSEDLYSPPTDPRLFPAEVTPARVPPIEPALYDWCTLLVTGGGTSVQVKTPLFIYESGKIGSAIVSYTPDPAVPGTGDFTTGLVRTGSYKFDFPAVCMRSWGARERPDLAVDPSGNNVNVCDQLQVPLAAAGQGEGSYPNVDCYPTPADPEGCECRFDVAEAGGPAGRYQILDSNTILHLSSGFPTRATYCNQGNRLELTGADGSYLFGVKGLRTLDLAAAP